MKSEVNGELGFNEESLGRFLRARLGADCETFQLSRVRGGQSNPTYFLNWGEQNLVLRKQPNGPILRGALRLTVNRECTRRFTQRLFQYLSLFCIVLSQIC